VKDNQTSICVEKTISIIDSEQKGISSKRVKAQEIKTEPEIEILVEGEECPNCHFSKLKREEDQIVCPICGYGRKACT
jgi:hypothetical protein